MPIMGECCEYECYEHGYRECTVTGDINPWYPEADAQSASGNPPPPSPSGEKE
jgi:hypothetical protein